MGLQLRALQVCFADAVSLIRNKSTTAPECVFPDLGDEVEAYKMALILYLLPARLFIRCVGTGVYKAITRVKLSVADDLWQSLSLLLLCSYWMWIALLK